MIRMGPLPSAALATAVVLQGAVARAQIDHRVNRGNTSQAGRALDHDPRIGSGGRIAPTRGLVPGARANAIITRNVTGLGQFHGFSPLLDANRFRAPLPSAGLSGFHAKTVDLGSVQRNRTPARSFYFGTQETIADLGFIREGLNQPGSSTLISPTVVPPRAQARHVPVDQSPIPDPIDLRIGIDSEPQRLGVFQRPVETAGSQERTGILSSPYGPAATSSIFGAPPEPVSTLPPVLAEQRSFDTRLSRPLGVQDRSPRTGDVSEALFGKAQAAPVGGRITGLDAVSPDETDEASQEQSFGTRQLPGPGTSEARARPGSVARPSDLGLDRFTDFLRAIRAAEQLGLRRLGYYGSQRPGRQAVGLEGDVVTRESELIQRPRRPIPRSRDQGLAELASAAKWAKAMLDDPVSTFVGRYQNKLNDFMAAGEASLSEGEYYKAARQFDLAHAVDPRNPLPLLARGHALIAAGAYVSAVHSLERGLERFPQIAAFRIDLPSLAKGQPDIFDIRRADLERQLAISDSYELRFLLGYIEVYSGLTEIGLQNLDRAAEMAPKGGIIAIFPDLLLGRRDLPALRQEP